MTDTDSKRAVAEYWSAAPCESDAYWEREGGARRGSGETPLSRGYFDLVEAQRYQGQSDIFGFAQFTRYRGKRVLEIGLGLGTDFIQWVRAGAIAYGVDLTETSVAITAQRLATYGLACADLRTADAESLPFKDDSFDLVYSWGVLHHTPDTRQALREVVRVTKPGGTVKLMLYNRYSIVALRTWLRWALLKGRPLQRISEVLARHMESPGTKAFTPREVRKMLRALPVFGLRIDAAASPREFGPPLDGSPKRIALFLARYALSTAMGLNSVDFFMKVQFEKLRSCGRNEDAAARPPEPISRDLDPRSPSEPWRPSCNPRLRTARDMSIRSRLGRRLRTLATTSARRELARPKGEQRAKSAGLAGGFAARYAGLATEPYGEYLTSASREWNARLADRFLPQPPFAFLRDPLAPG